jgi:hypothetical protein
MSDLIAVAFIIAIVSCILKTLGYRGVGVSVALMTVFLLGILVRRVGTLGGEILGLLDGAALSTARDLAKIVGISYLSSICESTCTSLGENETAKIVEVCGRVEIIAVLIPYFKSILAVGGALM